MRYLRPFPERTVDSPSKIAQPEAPRLSGFDPNVIAVRTGSIRGAGWGKFFEQVRSQAIYHLLVVCGWAFDNFAL